MAIIKTNKQNQKIKVLARCEGIEPDAGGSRL
jgi:hypothetical protein